MRKSIIFLCLILIIVLIGCDRYKFLDEQLWEEVFGDDTKDEEDIDPDKTNGLVGEWLFSGDAKDSSGNGNDGVKNGAVYGTDRFGNSYRAMYFDGVDDYVEIPDSDILDLTGDMTIALWVNGEDGANPFTPILQKGITGYTIFADDFALSTIKGYAFGIEAYGSNYSSDMNNNEWHFIVGTWDSMNEEFTIYVNNTKENSFIEAGMSIFPNSDNLNIGTSWQNTNNFQGYIDDVRIYNTVLTSAEMTALYESGGWTGPPAPIDYTVDSSCKGAWLMNSDATEDDVSGNGESLAQYNGIASSVFEKPPGYNTNGKSRNFKAMEYLRPSPLGSTDIFGSKELTLGLWFRADSLAFDSVLAIKGDYGMFIHYGLVLKSTGHLEGVISDTPVLGSTTLLTGNWYHAAIVYDRSTIKIYLDGAQKGSVGFSSDISNSGFDFTLGADSLAESKFSGYIDEVIIFDRALSATVVQDIMANGIDGSKGAND